ncbi:uncharacterized protein LOC131310187 [Rhododendron vialii]|uniref:uncharacterized protein LOC131310187 n=1 Tax=Rhododendron vialii TaxID=182163 RepID=UPI00265F20D4|nr:uncharacterized protein LOC131310187 [Rhododendron vialii]
MLPLSVCFMKDHASYPNSNRCDYYVIIDGGDEIIAAQARHHGTDHAIYQRVIYACSCVFIAGGGGSSTGRGLTHRGTQQPPRHHHVSRRLKFSKLFKFGPIKESIVSREMARRYMMDMITYADTSVVVVGAGFAGLSWAYEHKKILDVQVM